MQQAPELQPSWSVPIALGALAAFLLLLGLAVGQSVAIPAVSLTSFCCCMAGFLPSGFVPAWVAARRDPALTPGQGFAVAFIAVGLGTVVWATITALGAQPLDVAQVRDAIRAAQTDAPADRRMSDEQIETAVEVVRDLWPYLPAVYATVTTVLSGFVGMLVVGIVHGRPRARGGA